MGAKIDAGFSNLLNGCRWLAAFLVVISHVRGLVFPAAGALDPHDPVSSLFYFVTGFGHGAVILFFVLSGYLVGGNAIAAFRTGTFAPGDYLIARFSRIYTVFVPALMLGLVLDLTGSVLFASSGLYTHPPAINSLYFPIADRLDPACFLGNLLMLQIILVDPFGSNGPLWSLACEWWYYLLFGLLLWSMRGRSPRGRLAALAVVAGITALFPRQISLWSLIWLIGAGLAAMEPRRKVPLKIGLPVFLLLFALARIPWTAAHLLTSDFLRDFIVALGFALFLLSARQAERLPLAGRRLNALLADFSYSVYLFHFPLLIFLGGLAAQALPLPGLTGVEGGVFFAVLVVALHAAAFALSRLTEAKTNRVRAAIGRRLRPAVSEPVAGA